MTYLRNSLCAIALLVLAAGCGERREPTPQQPAAAAPKPHRAVHVLLFGRHPLLLAVDRGIEAGIHERLHAMGDPVVIDVVTHDAEFQPTNAAAQAKLAASSNPAAIVALGTPAIKAAIASTPLTIPILFGATSDAKALGLTASSVPSDWRKPGALTAPANLHGFVTDFDYDRIGELAIRFAAVGPRASSKIIGYPINESEPNSVLAAKEIGDAVAKSGYRVLRAPIASPVETPRATRYLLSKNTAMIQVGPDNMVAGGIGSVLAAAAGDKTPVLATDRESVRKGAIAAYSVDFEELGRQLGRQATEVITKKAGITPVSLFSQSKLFYNADAAAKDPHVKALLDALIGAGWQAEPVAAQ